jgi:hypothetical protein
MTTNRETLNRAQPGTVADQLRLLQFGDVLRALPCYLFGKAPALGNHYAGPTTPAYTAPNEAKVLSVLSAYARAGSGTLGPLALDTTPGAGKFTITPSGDVIFNATDAWTLVDLVYVPLKATVVNLPTLSVVANVATIPSAYTARGVVLAAEIESLAGTLVTQMLVMAPGTGVITTQAALNLAKTTVVFAAADAVTQCRVKLLVASATDVDAYLQATDSAVM